MKLDWEFWCKNKGVDPSMTPLDLHREILKYEPGGCLCTMRESCPSCGRSEAARRFEVFATRLAQLTPELVMKGDKNA